MMIICGYMDLIIIQGFLANQDNFQDIQHPYSFNSQHLSFSLFFP